MISASSSPSPRAIYALRPCSSEVQPIGGGGLDLAPRLDYPCMRGMRTSKVNGKRARSRELPSDLLAMLDPKPLTYQNQVPPKVYASRRTMQEAWKYAKLQKRIKAHAKGHLGVIEDISSGQFGNIVRLLPPLTSPSRPATSAPPRKFLHCFSDTKVRLPICSSRLRGPALPASDLSC